MRRIVVLLSLLAIPMLLTARPVSDPPKPAARVDTVKILSVGAIVIFSKTPDSLAAWYANKFGLVTPISYQGGHYGSLTTSDGGLQIGIMNYPKGMPVRGGGNIAITFRVNNYDNYLLFLAKRGLKPVAETKDKEGRFATFVDPDGNAISIWGK